MRPREEKYIYDWETKRGKGKWSYIIMTTLLWGTLLPVVVLAFKLAIKGFLTLDLILDKVFHETFLVTWIKYIACAFVFACLMWFLSRKKYKELKRKQMTELQVPH
jgi:hypothetical protein